MTQVTPTFTCKIDNSNWMGSLESAYVEITTPKGTTLTIEKWPSYRLKNKWDASEYQGEGADEKYVRLHPEAVELVAKIANSNEKTIELTKEEVMLFHQFSTAQDRDISTLAPKAKKQYPVGSYENPRKASSGGIKSRTCGCGGKLKTKDHGTWVGWFCPKCKSGGSYNK